MDLTYTYDDVGHVTGIADGRQGQSATYGYDALNRLVAATGPWGNLTYEYDAIGNRMASAVNGTTTTYSYGPTTNRLSSLIRDGQQFEGFDYDGLGRLTQDSAVQTYTYTPANLLETAQSWAGALNTSRYDADGRRVLKIAGSETSRTYVVNGLSEFSTEGGPLTWTVDYVSAGSRLLTAVRPAAGTLDTLTVTKAGTGAGRVTADPAGVDCGPDCAARYLDGTTVVLTAAATDEYSSFTGWGGSCSGTASAATVTVDAAKTCTATFTRVTFTLTIQKTGDGGGDSWVTSSPAGIDCGPTCSASIGGGAVVQLTPHAADGFEFVRWDGAGCATGTVLMDGARTCTAIFQATPPAGCDPEAEELCRSQGGRWDESACLCEMVSRGARVIPADGQLTRITPSGGRRVAVADELAAGGGGEPASRGVASVPGPGVAGGDLRSLGLAIARRLIDLAEWARPATGRGRVRAAAVCSGRSVTSGASASAWVVTGPTAAPPTLGPAAVWSATIPGSAGGPHESDEVAAAAPALPPPPTPLQVVEYYHLDAIGSVRAVTDAQGQVIARHDFLPFGEELNAQNPPRDRRLFTGQERDGETGLDYFHARQLRVDLGRFTVPDPLTDLAWTDGMMGATNAYGYVRSNPLGFIDPMGMQSQPGGGGDGTMVVTTCTEFGCDWKETVNVIALIYASPLGSTLSTREAEMVERPTEIQTAEGGGGTQANPAKNATKPCQVGSLNLSDNIQTAKALAVQFWSGLLSSGSPAGTASAGVAAGTYVGLVQTGGAWDPKTTQGVTPTNIAAGNINFGATCSQFGFNTWLGGQVCQYGAGIYGKLTGTYGSSLFSRYHGDWPSDNSQIRQGLAIAKKGGC